MQGVSATKQIPVTTNYGDTKVEFDLASATERKAFLNVVDSAISLKNMEIAELKRKLEKANKEMASDKRLLKMFYIVTTALAFISFVLFLAVVPR